MTDITNWGTDVVELEGVAPRDKAELLDVPFLMTGVWFETNARGIEYVYVEGRLADGETFTINDSSTGIKAQVEQYLASIGKVPAPGEIVDLNVLISKGLRVSEYEIKDERGRDKKARTYYLTTNGKRTTTDTKTTGRRPQKRGA